MNKDTCIIVPIYNEAEIISKTIDKLHQYFSNVVCVDDGSIDKSYKVISDLDYVHIVRHAYNLGQGAAIQTGIDYALGLNKIKYFITFDSDGQHDVKDALKMLSYIKVNEVDIVLGSRFLGRALNLSVLKRFVLKTAIIFSNFTTGIKLTDTHNGLRVFNRAFAEKLDIKLHGFAHASEIIHFIGENKFKYAEYPVTIRYTEYSLSKGQHLSNSVNIIFDLILRKVTK